MVNIVAFPISSLRRKWLFHYQGENFKCIKIGAFPTPQDCVHFSSVQFSHLVMSNCVTPWTAAHQALLSIINSQSWLKLMSIESVMLSSHLILCHCLLSPLSIFPSIRVFSNESVLHINSVQLLSHVQLFVIPWTAACQASLSITNSWSLLKLMSIESVMPSNHLILCRPLFLPSVFPSIRVFSNESVLHIRWPKY